MNRWCALILLLLVTSLTLSCGSGSDSNRQLQSITITQAANSQQIEFVATGHVSNPPATVTSIPVEWSIQLMAPPPTQYTLTPQPSCSSALIRCQDQFRLSRMLPRMQTVPAD
jgi:hypothetical protein